MTSIAGVVGYTDLLAARLHASGEGKSVRRNAPRTRLRIQVATCELLQRHSYDTLSISAICEATNLTRPGFYGHFKNKESVVIDVLRDLVKTEIQLVPSLVDCDELSEAVGRFCDWYFRFHVGAEALFATLTDLRRSVAAAYALQEKRSRQLHSAVSHSFGRFDEFQEVDENWATFVMDATARAMNTTANRLNEHAGPQSMHITNDVGTLIGMFSRMMYRSLSSEPMPEVFIHETR